MLTYLTYSKEKSIVFEKRNNDSPCSSEGFEILNNGDKMGENITNKIPKPLGAKESNQEMSASKFIILRREEIAHYQHIHTRFSPETKFLVAYDSLEDVPMVADFNKKSNK